LDALAILPQRPDFWLWLYLTLTVSSTMLPSSTDRQGWLPLGLILAGLVVVALLIGAGAWMMANLAPAFNRLLWVLALVFGVGSVVHLALLPLFWALRRLLSALTGYQIA